MNTINLPASIVCVFSAVVMSSDPDVSPFSFIIFFFRLIWNRLNRYLTATIVSLSSFFNFRKSSLFHVFFLLLLLLLLWSKACEAQTTLTDNNGTIQSPGYPCEYGGFQYCNWAIRPSGPASSIFIEFHQMSLSVDHHHQFFYCR